MTAGSSMCVSLVSHTHESKAASAMTSHWPSSLMPISQPTSDLSFFMLVMVFLICQPRGRRICSLRRRVVVSG